MLRNRAVGTLTLGISFVAFGVFFLYDAVTNSISYTVIFVLWPLVLVFLGLEVLISYFLNKEQPTKYSGVSIFLLVLLTMFSLGVGAVGYAVQNSETLLRLFRG
jgi:predicted membrane channel-forming protein YqfA (hemolysin III family)